MATADFTDSIADLYDAILGPFMFEPFARETAGRLAATAGEVLEIAAGTGILTRELDRVLGPAARIMATDLNPPMLAVGARKLGSARVDWRPADALALPFADASFDAVVVQFGVMFYPDKVAGHAEAARVLRPGGIRGQDTYSPFARLRAGAGNRNPVPRIPSRCAAGPNRVALVQASSPPSRLRLERTMRTWKGLIAAR